MGGACPAHSAVGDTPLTSIQTAIVHNILSGITHKIFKITLSNQRQTWQGLSPLQVIECPHSSNTYHTFLIIKGQNDRIDKFQPAHIPLPKHPHRLNCRCSNNPMPIRRCQQEGKNSVTELLSQISTYAYVCNSLSSCRSHILIRMLETDF